MQQTTSASVAGTGDFGDLVAAVRAARDAALKTLPPGPRRAAVAWTFDQEIACLSSASPEDFTAAAPPPLDGLPDPDRKAFRAFMSRRLARSLFGRRGHESSPAAADNPATDVAPARRPPRRDLRGV
ncbi:MAG: hypothetical protein MPK06_01290 [Alphaproteobacteria bacterium]|nr:hypothetical protein [Alphaproteobacteria bacterium]MDA7984102.1 hypothetical protein [Alphaproteobacteria bacterium]MDA7987066.1 hypothetical protein [Alphaproteobacteria bacterium]MDA7988142.1 hypothetical protein [Alphaproteobacteria bacterium]MDA8000096.1 hypothetical protein [Alphaproteobacteria bacterium]